MEGSRNSGEEPQASPMTTWDVEGKFGASDRKAEERGKRFMNERESNGATLLLHDDASGFYVSTCSDLISR
jgi:hypothetical protein